MKTNVLRVLPPSLFYGSLCKTAPGHPKYFANRSSKADNPKMGGGRKRRKYL